MFVNTDKLDSVWEEIQNRPKNVMFRQNQYWIIITKSKDIFERAVQNSDIPIDSNVLLCVRQGFVLEICLSSFKTTIILWAILIFSKVMKITTIFIPMFGMHFTCSKVKTTSTVLCC